MELTLEHLLAALNPSVVVSLEDGSPKVKIRLLRHSFDSDVAIAKRLDPTVDVEELGLFPPTAPDKIAALRTRPRLVQRSGSRVRISALAS